jgi:elongation factor G
MMLGWRRAFRLRVAVNRDARGRGSCRHQHTIRNVGIVAHIDAGKTTTSEQMLYISGKINSVGRVDDGDTVMDFLPQERERGITISSAAISLGWKNHDINLIDTPGHVDFTVEVERSARVLDGAVLVIDAVAGVQAQTATVWKQVKKQSIPSFAFINKMDRTGACFTRATASLMERLGICTVPIQLPIGAEAEFAGVVDLIGMNKIFWLQFADGKSKSQQTSIPQAEKLEVTDPCYEDALQARTEMLECLAELEEQFQDLYLGVEDNLLIPETEVLGALRRLCLLNAIVPVVCGSALKGKGVHAVLDSIVTFLPSPFDRPPCQAKTGDRNGGQNRPAAKDAQKHTHEISPGGSELCALAFKVTHDNARGRMVFARIYSGQLNSKQLVWNSTQNKKERLNQILKVHANEYESLGSIGPGSIACLIGLKHTITGDTIVDEGGKLRNYILDGMNIPRAVYSVAVEPERSSDQLRLEEVLGILQIEDPSLQVEINAESGQTLLKGIGELHIDIVCDKLRRQHNLTVTQSKTYIAFRESLSEATNEIKEYVFDRTFAGKRMFASVKYVVSVGRHSEATDCSCEILPSVRDTLSLEECEILREGLKVEDLTLCFCCQLLTAFCCRPLRAEVHMATRFQALIFALPPFQEIKIPLKGLCGPVLPV